MHKRYCSLNRFVYVFSVSINSFLNSIRFVDVSTPLAINHHKYGSDKFAHTTLPQDQTYMCTQHHHTDNHQTIDNLMCDATLQINCCIVGTLCVMVYRPCVPAHGISTLTGMTREVALFATTPSLGFLHCSERRYLLKHARANFVKNCILPSHKICPPAKRP